MALILRLQECAIDAWKVSNNIRSRVNIIKEQVNISSSLAICHVESIWHQHVCENDLKKADILDADQSEQKLFDHVDPAQLWWWKKQIGCATELLADATFASTGWPDAAVDRFTCVTFKKKDFCSVILLLEIQAQDRSHSSDQYCRCKISLDDV